METSARVLEEHERRGRPPQWVYWAYWATFASTLAVTLFAFTFALRDSSRHAVPAVAQNVGTISLERSGVETRSVFPRGSPLSRRPLFPYSIIPGGAESAQELRNAVAHDAVVASHFADFDLAKTRIMRLDRDRAVHVSYRLGDRVYWTMKRVKLSRGERIITDGEHKARTRCGNRISEAPSEPVSPQEPAEEAMEAALVLDRFPSSDPAVELPPISSLALAHPVQTPPESPPAGGIVPPFFPIVGGGSLPPPPGPPPVATPEPDTFALLATGVSTCLSPALATGVRILIRKRRKA